MANPFYPPRRGEHGNTSRGNIAAMPDQQPVPFDPDRRAGSIPRLTRGGEGPYDGEKQRYQDGADETAAYERRQPTDGPGGASTFYPSQYDYDQSNSNAARGNDAQSKPTQLLPVHAVYEHHSPQGSTLYLQQQQHDDTHGGMQHAPSQGYYSAENAARHQYPPANAGYGLSYADLHAPLATGIDRPDTPGIYRDRAPRMEKLTSQQRKIVETFPKDLDEEGGSLIHTVVKMCKDWRSFIKWKYLHYYLLLILLCATVALMTIYHKQIVDWLTPVSKKIRELSWGWVIPVAILFVISFPPLFGHEIVGVLCGIVYGLWIGFGILSLGTLLGELGNFYAFKYFLKKHGERYERKSIDYACMAHIVREGGFMVILLARLSAIPGHFTTAVFATVGMNVFVFTIAAILSLPKQLVVVYLGVALEQAGSGSESTRSKVIKYVVLILSFLVTIGVAVFLYDKMHKARPVVRERLRERRYQMLTDAAEGGNGGGVSAAQSTEALSSSVGHSKVLSDADETSDFRNGDAYDGLDGGKKRKQGSAWTRWMRTKKGKDVERGQDRHAAAGPDMAMHNVARLSYESEQVDMYKARGAGVGGWNGGRNAGGGDRYDDETLRPTVAYNDRYHHVDPYGRGATGRDNSRRYEYDEPAAAAKNNTFPSSPVDQAPAHEREPSGPYAMAL